MVFSSAIFLFLFLPAFLGIYYTTPLRFRSYIILIFSLFFYGWWRVDFLGLMLAVILWSYFIASCIDCSEDQALKKRWLIAGLVVNLGILGIFKYFNFGVDTMNILLHQAGFQSLEAIKFLLPIGISFYIFHAISFIVDIYRGDARMPRSIIDFAAFMTLFPQLVAGPILRFKDLAFQFESREHNFRKFSEGAKRFMIGFAKKVLIADSVAPIADSVFALPEPTMTESWLGVIAYAIQLYFDFSGYSDMAIGLGLMIGFRLMENFNQPYLSKTITEFWRRWHISLSTWLRDYLYIPLGGNRKGQNRTYLNLMVTMLLGGLWHGPNWTFILWGLLHGSVMSLERLWKVQGSVIVCTFVILIGWVLFRAENIAYAVDIYKGMMGLNGIEITHNLDWQIKTLSLIALGIGIFIVYGQRITASIKLAPYLKDITLFAVFVLAVMQLLAQNYSPFLYFQF